MMYRVIKKGWTCETCSATDEVTREARETEASVREAGERHAMNNHTHWVRYWSMSEEVKA